MKKDQKKEINNLIKNLKKVFKNKKVGLHEPILGVLEKKELSKCINSGFISTSGNYYIKQFERKLKKIVNSKNVIAVINGTSAIHIALKVLGIKKNDEVLMPSLNFVAAANAVLYCNAIPHFIDIEKNSFFIDPKKLHIYLKKNFIKKKNYIINKKTKNIVKAIIPFHTFGHSCDIRQIKKIANKFHLKIIEDAAEGLGSYNNGRHLGTFGHVGVLSFNGNKIVTSGGGGAILTDNNLIAKNARSLTQVSKIPHEWKFNYKDLGYNYRMPNINAALGFAQLKRLNKNLKDKRNILKKYKKIFNRFKNIKVIEEPNGCKSNYWLQNIKISGRNKIFKNNLINKANNKGISLRPAWCLLHKQNYLKKYPKDTLSNSNKMYDKIVSLPSNYLN